MKTYNNNSPLSRNFIFSKCLKVKNVPAPPDGQSWKTPQFIKISLGGEVLREVFLLTGGYDRRLDGDGVAEHGRSVYTIDVQTGAQVGLFMGVDDFPEMSSLVNAVALDPIDDDRSVFAQVYAADLGGHVYAARNHGDERACAELSETWQMLELFNITAGGKKIFEEVDIVPEKLFYFNVEDNVWRSIIGEYVFFGTGDRANPLRTDQINHFYCLKNDWRTAPMNENSRVGEFATLDDDPSGDPDNNDSARIILDLTDNLIQDGTDEERMTVSQALSSNYNRGWYIALENEGEKCLSAPIVYSGVVYFTTYTPPDQEGEISRDPCREATGNIGVSRLYALKYETGAAVYDFNDDGKLDREDRSKIISRQQLTIAPSPKIFITERGETLFIGPHQETPLSDLGGVRLFYWKSGE